MNIPVFHDDQHGTAIVVGAAAKNALHVAGKAFEDIKIVSTGGGAAGTGQRRRGSRTIKRSTLWPTIWGETPRRVVSTSGSSGI